MKIDKTNEGILQSLVTTEEVVLALKNLELIVQKTDTLVNKGGYKQRGSGKQCWKYRRNGTKKTI